MVGEEDPSEPRSLVRQSILTRLIVISAGSFMNAILPFVLFTIVFMIPQKTLIGQVRIQEVMPNSPAAEAGLKSGDTILQVNGHRLDNHANLIQLVHLNLGKDMEWSILRGTGLTSFGSTPELSTYETAQVVPRWNPPTGQGPTGISVSTVNPRTVNRSYPFWEAIPKGAQRVKDTLVLYKNEIARLIVSRSSPDMAGPIGIAQVSGEVAMAGFIPLLELAAFLSINLAIINMLPIPALDGGRAVFVILEWARRGKKISPQKEGLVHLIGFALLMSFVVIISYFDVLRLIRGESFLR